ncbi:MAG: vWA domain-containing protein [Coleofasciculus sp. B1-GNL1-01]|uniref:vWA domain-containing protein n=1 Tax=Coleofasciculus sp. B1-GNL1-01 TaxID=3068484 RepID=UPI0032F866B4
MLRYRRRLWLYPLFQIPLICLGICLVAAVLFALLGLGRPSVAVAIALDLSSSTFSEPSQFNQPGTVMYQEVIAVESYLDQNAQLLRVPNQIQVFGFAGVVLPLTDSFQTDSQQVSAELNQALQNPNLIQRIVPGTTDLNLAIQEGTDALSPIQDHCRELLLVTDGEADVDAEVIQAAAARRVKINAVVVGGDAPDLRNAAATTGGIYHSGQVTNLETVFTNQFFRNFNSNRRWVIFWLGAAWISLMWLLILPLDRWIFQGWLKLPMNLAGQLALGNAFFWTVATLLIVWHLAKGLPFISLC